MATVAEKTKPVPTKVRAAVRRHTGPRRHLRHGLLWSFHALMFLAVIGGGAAGVGWLWSTARADSRFRLDGETLALAGAVRECPESLAELEAIGQRFSGRSLLDPSIITDLRAAYEGSLWVKRVTRLCRSFPNRIQLEMLLRLPAAQVLQNRAYWLIDDASALLPVAGAARPFPGLPVIAGATAGVLGSRPAPGMEWRDDGVRGAVGILRAFWGSPLAEALPVERVVVTAGGLRAGSSAENGAGGIVRRRFEVVAASGTVVRWGTYNTGDLPGELTSPEKIRNLQELLLRGTPLAPGVCFDVRTRLPGFAMAGR